MHHFIFLPTVYKGSDFSTTLRTFVIFCFFKIIAIFYKDLFVFREKGREGERERETSMCKRYCIDRLPLACPLLGTLPATLVMCPDWELNWRPFSSQASAQSTEPHQPGQ